MRSSINRGIALAQQRDYVAALIDYSQAINLKPDSSVLYACRAESFLAIGNVEKAVADCTKAIDITPNCGIAYSVLARVKRRQGDLTGAVVDIDKALAAMPDSGEAYVMRASIRAALGQMDDAFFDCATAIKLKPQLTGAFYQRGCFYYNRQNWPEALADFVAAQALTHPGFPQFRIFLVRARAGEREAALADLRSYLDNKGGGLKPWPAKIGAFLADRISEADFFISAASSDKKLENEQRSEAFFYAGTIHLLNSDKSKAAEYFKSCVALDIHYFYEHQSALAELKLL